MIKLIAYVKIKYTDIGISAKGLLFISSGELYLLSNNTVCPDDPAHLGYSQFIPNSTYKYCWGVHRHVTINIIEIIDKNNYDSLIKIATSNNLIKINN